MEPYNPPYRRMKELNVSDVEISDGFWKQKIDINRNSAIFHQWEQLEQSQTIDNFRIVTGVKEGFREGYFYSDSDSHKWAEAAALILSRFKSEKLEKLLLDYLELIGDTQEEDGYVFTYNQFHFPKQRWINFQIEHELYSLGHLIEATCAFFLVSGNKDILKIGEEVADLILSDLKDYSPVNTPRASICCQDV